MISRDAWLGSCLLAIAAGSHIAAATSSISPEEAARFLTQATLGADWEEIQQLAELGPETWIEGQFERPVGYHQPFLDSRRKLGQEVSAEHRRWSWWEQVLTGSDPLRQRVALALSEHFVVSDEVGAIHDSPEGLANYYDMLLDQAFGNYRELLGAVTLHPIMGVYLSHLKNERSAPGRFPDENYAREVLQLFSIGLFRLRPDGTPWLDGAGQPIPTYDNSDITEFAKIFTGLSFDSPSRDFDEGSPVWTAPMRMYEEYHEPGPKYLLRGRFVPPGQPGLHDIADALDNLFTHPNTGPFVSRRLIQRLVTSNPNPAYVERVAAAFADNGAGVRGDMKAVIAAILLDPEARTRPNSSDVGRGMLRESFLRRVHLARAFNASNRVGSWPISDGGAPESFSQRPLSSPTVFNFFLPDHRPAGPIREAGLVGPEFQIFTSMTALSSANALGVQAYGAMNQDDDALMEVRLDLSDEIAIAADARSLVDRLDLLLMYGSMSGAMRQILISGLERLETPEERARMALHLIAISPEYCAVK